MALAAIMEGPNFALSMLQRPLIGTILFANILCIRDTRLPPQGGDNAQHPAEKQRSTATRTTETFFC